MATIIIGLIGKSGAGKDEVAKRLVAEHGYTRLAFADILKDVALAADPVIEHIRNVPWRVALDIDLNIDSDLIRLSSIVKAVGWDRAKKISEVRGFLQRLGAAVRDNIGEDAWVAPVMRRAAEIEGPVVITDVRYPNEADTIDHAWTWSKFGDPVAGKSALARVVRPGQHGLEGAAAQHASETALDDREVEFRIMNDRTIEQLHTEVDTLIEALGQNDATGCGWDF